MYVGRDSCGVVPSRRARRGDVSVYNDEGKAVASGERRGENSRRRFIMNN